MKEASSHLSGKAPDTSMTERRRMLAVDSAAVSIFVVILVELTNTDTFFVNSTNITTNIETTVLSSLLLLAVQSF